MFNSWSSFLALTGLVALTLVSAIQEEGMGNSIAAPGQPMYYLMADTGNSVRPNEELRRTNRSLLKWWDDLFGQNNCCNNNYNNNAYPSSAPVAPLNINNNCNGFQLHNLDPFKQLKLFKKLPDLFGNNCAGQCGGNCGQQAVVNNYESPGYGGPPQPPPVVGPPNENLYETPNAVYQGPGDGDAGYVAPPPPASENYLPPQPVSDSYVAPPEASYEPAAPSAVTYDQPAPPAVAYDPPAPPASTYEAPASPDPTYETAGPENYSKVESYAQPGKSYGGAAQPPQIVYQPIIYVSATPAGKTESSVQATYEPSAPVRQPPAYAPPAPAPCNSPSCGGYLPLVGVPVYNYAPPAPVYTPAVTPTPQVTSNYVTPTCQSPIRMSLADQPYRVAPELFEEYYYRLNLAEQNRL